MSLTSGTRLGAYEIVGPLGAGGMGEVYRARDTKLKRDVALKILPDAVAQDAERLARFQREAEVLASLNHPHIAQIYGFEEPDASSTGTATCAIAMELVDGEDLSERLMRGALPLDEVLAIARQLAEGLEAAHDAGIVHRDLKPANVKIARDGTVKVLDFGLARADAPVHRTAADAQVTPELATLPADLTTTGAILGTAAYMSPEQARGRLVDRRTDIWAFGCVVYEMLTGRRAFAGETVADVLAAIVEKNPDWQVLPAATPAGIRTLLERCLQKDARRRLPHVGSARLELEDVSSGQHRPTAAAATGRQTSRAWAVTAGITLALAGIAGGWAARGAPVPTALPVVRFDFDLPVDRHAALGSAVNRPLVVSADGTKLVYFSGNQLFLRTLDREEAVPLAGTEGVATSSHPILSPDGQWIAFFRNGSLIKVPAAGGAPAVICAADVWAGGSWGDDDQIVFAQLGGIFRVSSNGGTPERLAIIDDLKGEEAREPQMLPGGTAVLYSFRTRPANWDKGAIVVQRLGESARRVVVEGAMSGRYLRTGHLVFGRLFSLFAQSFDVSRLVVTGEPVQLADDVPMQQTTTNAYTFLGQRQSTAGWADYSVSEAALAHLPSSPASSLVWVDRRGTITSIGEPTRGTYHTLRLAPDGRRVVVDYPSSVGEGTWVKDLVRGTRTLLTRTSASLPTWSVDGGHVTFVKEGPSGAIVEKSADGTGAERTLSAVERSNEPAWSPDGKALLVTTGDTSTGADIWVSIAAGPPQPLVKTPANERAARFSPDGRYIAYQSDESGRLEVYVQPYPGPGPRVLVSTGGGTAPVWARDGSELFYHEGTAMMAVPVRTAPTFSAATPVRLFDVPVVVDGTGHAAYDVAADGRFLMIQIEPQTRIKVVLNWNQELMQRVPPR